jgi:integrase
MLKHVWTAHEARKFLSAVKQHGTAQDAAFFALALDSGMRKAELLGLQWRDLEKTTLRLERQLQRGRTETAEPRYALPKGKRGRTFDLSDETVALLLTHKRQQAELKLANRPQYRDHGLMFAKEWEHIASGRSMLGTALNGSAPALKLDRFCKEASVKRIKIHGLRHTSASLLLSVGVPPHVVQKRLGHSAVAFTLTVSSHVLPSQQADAASRLATLLH